MGAPSYLFTEKNGSLSAVGYAKEAVFGTPVAATGWIPASSDTFTSDPGLFFPDLMQGIRDKQIYPLYGEEKNIGAITAPFFPSNGIAILVAAVGADVVTGTAAPYTHTVSTANTLASLTMEKNIGNFQSLQFAGCRVGKLGLKAATGNKEAEFSADFIAQTVAILTTPTTPITVVNESPFVFAEFNLTWQGYQIAQATNFDVEIDNGLKETYTFNQNHSVQFITPTSLKVSGSFDVVFDLLNNVSVSGVHYTADGTTGNLTAVSGATGIVPGMSFTGTNIPVGAIVTANGGTTLTISKATTGSGAAINGASTTIDDYFYQAANGTEAALNFTMTHPAGYSVAFNMPAVRLSKTDQKTAPGSVIMETVNFEAYYDLGQGSPKTIQVIVSNGVSAQY